MTDKTFRNELISGLILACQQAIQEIPKRIQGEVVYGVSLYTTEDYSGFCIAVNTEEGLTRHQANVSKTNNELLKSLHDHPDLLSQFQSHSISENYFRIIADEWQYIDIDPDAFRVINKRAEEYIDACDHDDVQLDTEMYFAACSTTLRSIRDSDPFTADCFANDVLLCLQFSDAGTHMPRLLELALSLNSDAWKPILNSVWT